MHMPDLNPTHASRWHECQHSSSAQGLHCLSTGTVQFYCICNVLGVTKACVMVLHA